MSKPFIFLSFANQKDRHLDLLKQESSDIKDILRELETRDIIKVEREESVEVKDILKTLSAYPDQLTIFHYAGHAGGELLELEDESANAIGLAGLLGEQKNLKLVFLNGCSTKEQVDLLLKSGVKAVIATSVPVNDTKAKDFSTAFYQALANKRTLKRAFEFAKARAQMKHKDLPEMTFRGSLELDSIKEKEMPWGLYYLDENANDILSWRLPYYRAVGLPSTMIQYIGKQFKINRYVVMVLDEMCKYNKDIYSQMVEVKDGKTVEKDSSTYLDIVIKNFPWVIGSQVQLLRQKTKPDMERLEQLVSTYVMTNMLVFYILLSNFWDELRKSEVKFPKGFLKSLRLEDSKIFNIDFPGLIKEVGQLMKEGNCQFFVEEMEPFINELRIDSHLSKATVYLEKLKTDLVNGEIGDLEKTCLTAERPLAVILQKVAFLAVYRMLTVRNISINNPRYGKETYELNLGTLNAIVNTSLSLYEDDKKRRKESYSNCQSIVLVMNEDDLTHSLNLSPFIIDKNTFLNNDHIDLFMYGFEKDDHYHYFAVKHSIFIALRDERGTDIIHSGMTEDDFKEGRNINKKAEEEDFGFGDAFGFEEEDVAVVEGPPVFSLLEEQFEQLKSDLS